MVENAYVDLKYIEYIIKIIIRHHDVKLNIKIIKNPRGVCARMRTIVRTLNFPKKNDQFARLHRGCHRLGLSKTPLAFSEKDSNFTFLRKHEDFITFTHEHTKTLRGH